MSKIAKKMKIMQPGGTLSDYVPIGAEAENINVDGESVETKLGKKPYYYDTVADMKADTKLKVGDMAITLGYYNVNDGGSAEYQIISGSYIEDGGKYHLLNNGLYAKIIVKNNFINVEQFGAKGDGTTDDTQAMISAFENGNNIILGNEKTYLINNSVVIYEGTTIEMNGSCISGPGTTNVYLLKNFLSTDTYLGYEGNGNIIVKNGYFKNGSFLLVHGKNITFENINFKDCTTNHWFQICACKNTVFKDCSFIGMTANQDGYREYINVDNCVYSNFPYLPKDSVSLDGTIVDGLLVDNCIFDINNTKMRVAVGKHSYYSSSDYTLNRAKNITIRDCKVYGAQAVAFNFQGAENVKVKNCWTNNCHKSFRLLYCDNVEIGNNIFDNQAWDNEINNSSKIYITYNKTKLTVNDSWETTISDSDDINYLYNTISNTIGSNLPVRTLENSTVTNLNLFGNNYTTIPSTSANVARGIMSYPPTTATITFKNTQEVAFKGVGDSVNTVSNPTYDLTNVNKLILKVGSFMYETYTEIIVNSWIGSNFRAGDKFKVPVVNNGEIVIMTITIVDNHTFTNDILGIRAAYIAKESRG